MSDFLDIPTDGLLNNDIVSACCPSKLLHRPKNYLTENEVWPVWDRQEKAGSRIVSVNYEVEMRWIGTDGEGGNILTDEQQAEIEALDDFWNARNGYGKVVTATASITKIKENPTIVRGVT